MQDLIAKKYRVLKVLGQGAMGEVFLVMPPRGEPVALKLLKSGDEKMQAGAISQFENEFKTLKKLSHPNIGKIFDFGFDEEAGKVYFTSPWLKGSDLFKSTKDQSFEKCEELFVQMLRALNYLHQKKLIHCDLKPGNVFVENDGVQLIDFGLAGYWGDSIVGTPTYLAPEIFKGERHNVTSDLYAVGVVFYNCLARTQPFSGKNIQEVYDRHRTHLPPPLSTLNENVPKYFSDIALTLLSKKPSERFQSAAAVIEEIAAFSKTKYTVETQETLMSYLPATSEIIGRKDAQLDVDKMLGAFLKENPDKPYMGLFFYGESGTGRSKFLSQIKTRLQLEKISVEDAILPLNENDLTLLKGAKVIMIEDLDHYVLPDGSPKNHVTKGDSVSGEEAAVKPADSKSFADFCSMIEQKVLSPETKKFLLIATADKKEYWPIFQKYFPEDEFLESLVKINAFDQAETRQFLETIIGQSEIPDNFVSEIFRNTNGNPALCQQIVQSLIEKGLLFDESGRWSPDLVSKLESILKNVEPPKSLEEHLKHEYLAMPPHVREVCEWLALSNLGLTADIIYDLLDAKPENYDALILELVDQKIIRKNNDSKFVLYKSVFVNIIKNLLDAKKQEQMHLKFSQLATRLDEMEKWYHESFSSVREVSRMALEKMALQCKNKGQKQKSLEYYQRLISDHAENNVDLVESVGWRLQMADLLIWMDQFEQAVEVLTEAEISINHIGEYYPLKSRLMVWEKKGLSLLHQQRLQEAGVYFSEGARLAKLSDDTKVEEVRLLNDMAQIDIITGHPELAISKFEKTRVKAHELSPDDMIHVTNNDLGHVHLQLKHFEQAIPILKDDIRVFTQLPNREPLARACYALAESFRAMKRFEESIEVYEKCIEISKEDNFLGLLLRAYNGLGNIYFVSENYNEALEVYQRAIEISVHLKDPITKAALLVNQGLLYRFQKNLPLSSRRFFLAKQILESKENRLAYEIHLLSKCYNELTAIAREQHDSMKAITFQMDRIKMIEQNTSLNSEMFSVRLELAQLYYENRLKDAFEAEIDKLFKMAKTKEDKEQVIKLKSSWQNIEQTDQESTQEIK